MTESETVLVTGAGGFIGRHLVDYMLALNRRVIALDVDLAGIRHLHGHALLRPVEADICSHDDVAALMKEVDVVFNLAAAHLEVVADEDHYQAVNVDALENMLQAAASENILRFVHCSTVGVYGPLEHIPADEQTTCKPDIAYERTKLAGEAAVRRAVSSTDLSAVIIRPSWVYGPGCPRTLKLFRSIAKRRFFFVGDGQNLRHPIYITDLLAAFDLASNVSLTSGETIIVAGPHAVTTKELVQTIITLLGIRFRPRALRPGLVAAGCRLMEKGFSIVGRQPPFSTRSLKFFTDNSSFSIEKARHLLAYEPEVTLEQGLSRTLAYIKKQGLI